MAKRTVGTYITRPGRCPGDKETTFPVAKDLLKVPGTPRKEDEITFHSKEYPLESFAIEESASAHWAGRERDRLSPQISDLYKRFATEIRPVVDWIRSTGDLLPTAIASGSDVTDQIKLKARSLGYGEVGFTRLDRRYIYESKKRFLKRNLTSTICLAYEQDYVASQKIPGIEAEVAQGETYVDQARSSMELVDFIRSLGYRAQVSGPVWHFGPMIPQFVEAGLGQLGVNGQLLSPHFGSRARLQVIFTDAKLTYTKPVDFGITKFCETCQVCFIRCPGKAIQGQKIWFRGVQKSKLIYKRCRPVMARFAGCGVCIKVCPIQKYGMKPVMEHYVKTGTVLGKGTENLEAYELPGKGYFSAGKLPKFESGFFDMPTGKLEDNLLMEFKRKVNSEDSNIDDTVWLEFTNDLKKTINKKPNIIDMGMDMEE